MTARLQAWIRQAQNDLAMAEFARSGQFYAQSCYHCSQAAEKALKGLLIGLGQDPPRSHSLERLVDALADMGLEVESLRALQLKSLSRMTTATRYPDADEAPADLFDQRDCDLALGVAKSVPETVTKSLEDADRGSQRTQTSTGPWLPRLEAVAHLLVHQGVEGDGRAHQGLVAQHHPAVALQPGARISGRQAGAIAMEQLQVLLLGQQGEHQPMDALAAVTHGARGRNGDCPSWGQWQTTP